MIKYLSTRGSKKKYTFSEVVVKGIASDGGLFVPETLPAFSLSALQELAHTSYQNRALWVLSLFETDFSQTLLKRMVHRAYGKQFDTSAIVPLRHLQTNQYLLELWHGPTSAFKDMALQLMPLFFEHAIQKEGKKKQYLILVATSGDTGKAALEGYKDKHRISIMVFYPYKGVSLLQEKQMATQLGENVTVVALKGDFDAVQKCVKEVFADASFAKALQKQNIFLSSANSINWGRLLSQIVYYICSYVDLAEKKHISWGDTIDVAVPTGNFGNILAAFYAKQMGVPIGKLICASNENHVLTDFLRTGVYDISKRKLVKTPSPSMDILVASNVERLLYTITNDPEKVSLWMADLRNTGKFVVDEKTAKMLKEHFYAGWISNKECLQNIKQVYEGTHVLLDPHTSVAQKVAEKYSQETKSSLPMVIVATAHFSKFAKDVSTALYGKHTEKDEFAHLETIAQKTHQAIPKAITGLAKSVERFTDVCEAGKKSVEEKILHVLLAK